MASSFEDFPQDGSPVKDVENHIPMLSTPLGNKADTLGGLLVEAPELRGENTSSSVLLLHQDNERFQSVFFPAFDPQLGL